MLADKRLSDLSEWDDEILALELEELSLLEQPFEITAAGFGAVEPNVTAQPRCPLGQAVPSP